jgi:hypothetical protein
VYFSKPNLSSSNKNNFHFFESIKSTSSTIFLETFSQYKFFHFIFLFQIDPKIISAIRLELTGGAIIFVQAKIVSDLSLQNLKVTQGVQTIFASSCILQLSVTTAQAFEIISITSA